MTELAESAPSFRSIAQCIVWSTVATVDRLNRPRWRILQPWRLTALSGEDFALSGSRRAAVWRAGRSLE